MFERFTDRSRKVLALANQEAQRFNHEYIGTEHLLLGLVKEGSGVGANVLKTLDVDLRKVRLEVEKLVKMTSPPPTMGKLPQSPRAKKVIQYAIEEARNLKHNYVGTEHLLLGLLREQDGAACSVLSNLGVSVKTVKEEVTHLLGEEKVYAKLMNPELLSQLQKIAHKHDQEVLAPFSFRFIEHDARYELLDSEGKVLDTKTFGGPVGAYMFNALRKHEASQRLLREARDSLSRFGRGPLAEVETQRLIHQIERILDF